MGRGNKMSKGGSYNGLTVYSRAASFFKILFILGSNLSVSRFLLATLQTIC
jgi:hypothetical protein